MRTAMILVVEDEGIVAFDIQNQLEEIGYASITIASSGEEAIEQAISFAPDLLLMDINLKGEIDGVEAASMIQTHLHVPVIYLTAQADEDTLIRANRTKPSGYLIKPFETKDLATLVETTLNRATVV